MTRMVFVALALALVGTGASAEDMHGMAMGQGHKAQSLADKAYMAGMARMQKAMGVPMTGDADRDFAAMMIPHHEGAIDMAKVELQHGKDPAMRKLAQDIVAAQETEIATMKGFLGRR